MIFDASIPWAIHPESLIRLDALATEHRRANSGHPQAAAQRQAFGIEPGLAVVDGVAVVDVVGPMTKGYSWLTALMGGTSMQHTGSLIEQAAASGAVKGVLLRIDSPGGTVDGVETLARTVTAARARKPVLTYASGSICSAAYWVGSAAGGVYLESGATMAGSIGVVSKHVDISGLESRIGIKTTEITAGKFKIAASAHEPLSDAGRSTIQAHLDHVYGLFVGAVASHRGKPIQTVLDRMADGRIFLGQQAIAAGLADGFATQAELMDRLRSGSASTRTTSPSTTQRTQTMHQAMTQREVHQAAYDSVGAGGTEAQYKAAVKRLTANAAKEDGPICERTGLSKRDQANHAELYAMEHGCDIVTALKKLGYAS